MRSLIDQINGMSDKQKTEALMIAVEALEGYKTLPGVTFGGTQESLSAPAKNALSRIRSLPL